VKQLPLVFVCSAGANSFIVPVVDKSRPVLCKTGVSALPGATKTVDIKPVGGNSMLSGSLNAAAKGVSDLVFTTTAADAKQVVSASVPMEITISVTNACNVSLLIGMDDYLINDITY